MKWVLLLLSLTLCACSQAKDGAPSGTVDLSQVHNAKPRILKRTSYGNPKSYTVLGKTYYVLKSPYGYHAVGYASWYGTKFNGKLTSSGERYDMYKMTAANKVLPVPCYVKVTNIAAHKTIIVKVNDRGPFHEDRIIDLSYVAALKLGIVGHGTAMVSVSAIDPRENVANQGLKTLYVQAGSFADSANAKRLSLRLQKLTHQHTDIVPITLNGKRYNRVYLGPLDTLEQALTIERQLKSIGIKHPVTLTHL
ncbi:MAG: septal ring lytic transglycosylase RlpA family lipoprotein [Gammaproteobacteria bacterium CG11_big_fil_rev_8_21_14_0_20_46_22]|nr:MAG: septal ring lytic transglycosylase RlpA family lipoprotein [Gammaproteobacteria bacterium CG12_big_fil_rev_8_21_14_0_65_46_12]PIR10929.1 MAG: septal ring lytic transglycosylase RlpA family lipoprotein [Gammaproteobacteria bacterium CG11_big_fil_rev_8_21_14_0_20_46_22]